MRFTTKIPSGEHVVFAEGSWDQNEGKTIPLTMNDRLLAHATILETKIVDDGDSVEVTLEVDAEISVMFNPSRREMFQFSMVPFPRLKKENDGLGTTTTSS